MYIKLIKCDSKINKNTYLQLYFNTEKGHEYFEKYLSGKFQGNNY